jgi:hypothetical protein
MELEGLSSSPQKAAKERILDRFNPVHIFTMYLTSILILSSCLLTDGCETWSLTVREDHCLMVFGNRALKRIFGPKREEVAGDWRRLHDEELHNLYTSPNVIRVMK